MAGLSALPVSQSNEDELPLAPAPRTAPLRNGEFDGLLLPWVPYLLSLPAALTPPARHPNLPASTHW